MEYLVMFSHADLEDYIITGHGYQYESKWFVLDSFKSLWGGQNLLRRKSSINPSLKSFIPSQA